MEFRYRAPIGWEAKELNIVTLNDDGQPVHAPLFSKRYLREILAFACGTVYGMVQKGQFDHPEEVEWLEMAYRRLRGALNSNSAV